MSKSSSAKLCVCVMNKLSSARTFKYVSESLRNSRCRFIISRTLINRNGILHYSNSRISVSHSCEKTASLLRETAPVNLLDDRRRRGRFIVIRVDRDGLNVLKTVLKASRAKDQHNYNIFLKKRPPVQLFTKLFFIHIRKLF